jgi:hypothetical protein
MTEKKIVLVIKNLETTVLSPHDLAFQLIKRKKITNLNSLPT